MKPNVPQRGLYYVAEGHWWWIWDSYWHITMLSEKWMDKIHTLSAQQAPVRRQSTFGKEHALCCWCDNDETWKP